MIVSLFKIGRIWYARINGQRISTKCRDKRDAETVLADLKRQALDPAYQVARTYTFAEAFKDAIAETRRKRRSEGTVRAYQGHYRPIYRTFVGLLGEDFLLADIDRRAINYFIDERRRQKTGRKDADGSITPVTDNTISKELSILRIVMKVARSVDKFTGDISRIMPLGFDRRYQPRSRFLTFEEFRKLLGVLGAGHAAHIAAAVSTATRLSETFKLTRAQLEEAIQTNLIHIHGTKTKGSDRIIPIVGFMVEIMQRAVDLMKSAGLVVLPAWDNIHRDLDRACERAGIAHISPNDLRRTMTVWLRDAGVIPADAARILGHADARMVERVYGRRDPGAIGATIARQLAGVRVFDGATELDGSRSSQGQNSVDLATSDGSKNDAEPLVSKQIERPTSRNVEKNGKAWSEMLRFTGKNSMETDSKIHAVTLLEPNLTGPFQLLQRLETTQHSAAVNDTA